MSVVSKSELLLGQLAIRRGLVAPERIAECLAEQTALAAGGNPAPPLGALLLGKGYLSDETLAELLAVQAEAQRQPDAPLAEEAENLFGRRLVAHRFATAAQVDDALRLQAELRGHGMALRLGELLVSRGVLTGAQVRDALALQDKTILRCHACAKSYNVAGHVPGKAVACPKCSGPLAPAGGSPSIRVAGTVIRALRQPARQGKGPATPAVAAPAVPATMAAAPAAADRTVRRESARTDATLAEAPAEETSPPSAAGATVVRGPMATVAPRRGDRGPAPGSGPLARRRFGKYELVEELGRGGMGVVYKAYHPALKSYFAVKVLLAGGHASSEEVKRFQREAQAAARLKHPGILSAHDIGEEEGKTYFAMDYVEGAGLDKVLENPVQYGVAPGKGKRGRSVGVNVSTALQWTHDIAEALHAAHAAGVVHRDLKPANVIRDAAGRLKVMDFGLAKLVDEAQATGATRTGALMGTPAYMSPEQADGRVKEVDARSDVYQVGAILYALLTGRPPYDGSSAMEIVLKVMQQDPQPPRQRNPAIDRDAETICLKAMAREKGKRYVTARALAEDCARALAGEAILARAPA